MVPLHRGLQAGGDRLQHLVRGGVAKVGVDTVETVQVDQKQGEAGVAGKLGRQRLGERLPGGELRQRVTPGDAEQVQLAGGLQGGMRLRLRAQRPPCPAQAAGNHSQRRGQGGQESEHENGHRGGPGKPV